MARTSTELAKSHLVINKHRTTEFKQISLEIAKSCTVATKHYKILKHRLLIAFQPTPELARRKRAKEGEKRKKRDDTPYRRRRAHECYLEALKHGSCFFIVFLIICPPSIDCHPALNTLIEDIVDCQFSVDNDTKLDFEKWAQEENYHNNEKFHKFLDGLPLLDGLSLSLPLFDVGLIDNSYPHTGFWPITDNEHQPDQSRPHQADSGQGQYRSRSENRQNPPFIGSRPH
jgi:hypothetical protein